MHNSSSVPTVAPSDMLTKEDRNTILKCLLKEHQVQREAEKNKQLQADNEIHEEKAPGNKRDYSQPFTSVIPV